ncbi:MAG: hypothetical protein OEW52_11940 [Thermoleophilia bacterium]|nr:hypothetical protein [Thermoleophilia bacterium]MDH4340968.1 hypothetical protein [Thermoleophilia bacterium]MDH5281836.1 hypothetical protein [Thermoleophilia bacterium]
MSEVAAQTGSGRELYVRHARIDGGSVAVLRAVDEGDRCVVETAVWPNGPDADPVHPGPYSFPTPVEATRFVTHVVEAFIALGCEVGAS